MLVKPNGTSFEAVIKLVKVPISENIPISVAALCSSMVAVVVVSKLAFAPLWETKNLESGMLRRLEADDVDETASVAVAVVLVRLELSLLELEVALRSLFGCGGDAGDEEEDFGLERLVLRQPPPTGTLRRTPPLVQ